MTQISTKRTDPNKSRESADGSWIQRHVFRAPTFPIAVATVLLFILAEVFVPKAMSGASLLATIAPASALAVAAIGQTLVIQQKGIDLSTAGMITLSGSTYTWMALILHAPEVVALIASLLVGIAGGYVNGFVVTRLHITPIVTTLATNFVLYGVVWSLTAGGNSLTPAGLTNFVSDRVGPLTSLVWISIILVLIVTVFMAKSATGRRFVGVGASPNSARAAGTVVARYVIGAYVSSGFFSAVAGILLIGYLGSSSPNLGDSYQLPVIAAVIVGGAALTGGRASVLASAIACLFLTQVLQMIVTLGAPTSVQLLVESGALAVAAAGRLIPFRRFAGRFRIAPRPNRDE